MYMSDFAQIKASFEQGSMSRVAARNAMITRLNSLEVESTGSESIAVINRCNQEAAQIVNYLNGK